MTAAFVIQRAGVDVHFSYLTDPHLFIMKHIAHSKWLAVGGDKGGAACKVGITYELNGSMTFAPLVVYTGKDDWTGLSVLGQSPTPFRSTVHSTHFSSYIAVLQWLIEWTGSVLRW